MNLKTKLAASILMLGSASMAQAVTYDVAANFSDGGMQAETLFNGSFDFDASTNTVTSFSGLLSEAMWGWNSTRTATGVTGMYDSNGTDTGGMGGVMGTMNFQGDVYNPSGSFAGVVDNEAPLIMLGGASTRLVSSYDAGTGLVTATAFLRDNDTDVFTGGGYDWMASTSDKYGSNSDGFTANKNAFFTLVLDTADLTNTAMTLSQMQYGDCTALGLMSGMLTGDLCMTGGQDYDNGIFGGSMGGAGASLAISEVSAVPVPAAAWLFGGALMSLFGANRRKNVLPA